MVHKSCGAALESKEEGGGGKEEGRREEGVGRGGRFENWGEVADGRKAEEGGRRGGRGEMREEGGRCYDRN